MAIIEVELREVAGEHARCMYLEEDTMRNDAEASFQAIKSNAEKMIFGRQVRKITYADDEGDDCTLSALSIADALEFCEEHGKKILKLKVEPEKGEFSAPPRRVKEAVAAWEAAAARVAHSRDGAAIEPKELRDDVVAWSDRSYTYQNVPSEMVGASLYPSKHKPAGGGYFSVEATAGATVYIFCEAHRDGGFPALGWSVVEVGRFQWFDSKAQKTWGMMVWKKEADGATIEIPTVDCLVGGVAIQMPTTSAPKEEVPRTPEAEKLIEMLKMLTMGLDIRKVLPKLAEVGLRIIDDTQIQELFVLLDPLVSLAEGSMDLDQLPVHVALGVEVVKSLHKDAQKELGMRAMSALMGVVGDLRNVPSTVEVHPNVICDGCEQCPITGPCYHCDICGDFDFCGACHAKRHELHPEHDQWTLRKASQHADVVSFSFNECSPCVTCDGCNKCPLAPHDRHKCKVCPDYDLCSSCYSQRATIHPEHDSFDHFSCEMPQHGDEISVPAAAVPPGVPPPVPEAEPATEDVKHFYVGDEELKPQVISTAMAHLLEHPDEAVRAATRQAICLAMCAQEAQAAESDAEETAPTSSDGDWEKPSEEGMTSDTVSQVSDEVVAQEEQEQDEAEAQALEASLVAAKSAKVMDARMNFGDSAEVVFDLVESRGDVTEEFAGILSQYPGVTQAFRIGHLAVYHGATEASATAKVVVTNDGALPWPELSKLRSVTGPAYGFPEMELGPVPPGDAVELVLDLSLGLGQQGEAAMSGWAMVDEEGQPFGPLLVFDVARV